MDSVAFVLSAGNNFMPMGMPGEFVAVPVDYLASVPLSASMQLSPPVSETLLGGHGTRLPSNFGS